MSISGSLLCDPLHTHNNDLTSFVRPIPQILWLTVITGGVVIRVYMCYWVVPGCVVGGCICLVEAGSYAAAGGCDSVCALAYVEYSYKDFGLTRPVNACSSVAIQKKYWQLLCDFVSVWWFISSWAQHWANSLMSVHLSWDNARTVQIQAKGGSPRSAPSVMLAMCTADLIADPLPCELCLHIWSPFVESLMSLSLNTG